MHEPTGDISSQEKVQLGCFLLEKGGNKVWILGRAIYLEKGEVCGTVAELGSWYTGRWGEMRGSGAAGKRLTP